MTKPAHSASVVLALLAALAATSPAFAQGLSDAAAAARRGLILQAQSAREQGAHDRALDLATQAGRIQMSPSLRRFIAEEQNARGLLAQSLRSALLCVQEAERDNAPGRNAADHLRACQTLVQSLGPRVAHIVVQVPSPAPAGLHMTVAGEDVPEALWNIPYEVTPGRVRVDADAPGSGHFRADVTAAAGATVTLPLALQAPAQVTAVAQVNQAPPTRQAPPTHAETATPAPAQPAPPSSPAAPGINPGPFVVMGVGALSFVAAGLFYWLRNKAESDWMSMCPIVNGMPVDCPDSGLPAYQRELVFNGLTDAAIAVGGVALGAGILWLIVSRMHGERSVPPTALLLVPSNGGVSVQLGGAL